MGKHPDQNRLLQALGSPDQPKPRHERNEFLPGDALIICSDGFWEHTPTHELEKLVSLPLPSQPTELNKIVQRAVQRGGAKADNTTAILIHTGGGIHATPKTAPPWLLPAAIAAAIILLLLTLRPGQPTQQENLPPTGRPTPTVLSPGQRQPNPEQPNTESLPQTAKPPLLVPTCIG